MESSYFGGHIGVGYIARPSDNSAIDFFGKALWTRVEDDEAKTVDNDIINIDATNSIRSQLGMKYSYNFGGGTVFVKGAWEHEFDGETKGNVVGTSGTYAIRKTDTGGSSGLAEFGVQFRPTDCMTIGASVYGIIGKRKGFGGNVNVGFNF